MDSYANEPVNIQTQVFRAILKNLVTAEIFFPFGSGLAVVTTTDTDFVLAFGNGDTLTIAYADVFNVTKSDDDYIVKTTSCTLIMTPK